jgi:fructokinase
MTEGAPAPRFLAIGEALVDVIHRPDAVAERHAGGSPTNVAVGLARFGRDVTELCSLGDDADGALLREHLRSAGVALHPDAVAAERTSTAEVTLADGGDATYVFDVSWQVPGTLDWDAVDVAHAGSIALALEPGASGVLALLQAAPDRVRISIDPNVRPAFLAFEGAAARLQPFLELADLVKLSDEDAEYLYPGEPIDAVLDRLLDLGAGIAAVTRGGDGATLATRDARVEVPASAPHVADTVGAGDSFMAGLLDAIATLGDTGWAPGPQELAAIADHAARASAITVGRAGADLPWRSELPEVARP